MTNFPKRKQIRIEDYDYSTPGAYFITICTANREKFFWSDRSGRTQFAPTTMFDKIRRDNLCVAS